MSQRLTKCIAMVVLMMIILWYSTPIVAYFTSIDFFKGMCLDVVEAMIMIIGIDLMLEGVAG